MVLLGATAALAALEAPVDPGAMAALAIKAAPLEDMVVLGVKVALGKEATEAARGIIMAVREDTDPRRSTSSRNNGPSSDLRRQRRPSPSKDPWTSWLTSSTVWLPEFFW